MRRTPQSLRRHLLLLLLTLLLTPLIPTLTVADSGDDAPLGPTQIAGDLPPPETDGTAVIQWGGGSLHQLTARLAVNGCDLNLLWIYDDQTQKYTAPYTFDGPSFLNAPFERLYGKRIPPTTLWVKCIDMVQHVYGYGLLDSEERMFVDTITRGSPGLLDYVVDPLTDCGNHWTEEVKTWALPVLPVLQDLCILLFDAVGAGGTSPGNGLFLGTPLLWPLPNNRGVAVHANRPAVLASSNRDQHWRRVMTEFHELCHANQAWQAVKRELTYDNLSQWNREDNSLLGLLRASEYLTDFIDLVGFEEDAEGNWALPRYHGYHGLYYGHFSPVEMSAELCSYYLLLRSRIDLSFLPTHFLSRYRASLTAGAIDWLEEYVFVLPESRMSSEGQISGRVVDTLGRPVAGEPVWACEHPGGECHYMYSSRNGSFSLHLPVGKFTLQVAPAGGTTLFYIEAEPGQVSPDIPSILESEGSAASEIVFEIQPYQMIEGRVIGPDGGGVNNMNVFACAVRVPEPNSACVSGDSTGVDGSFRFRLIEGDYRIKATPYNSLWVYYKRDAQGHAAYGQPEATIVRVQGHGVDGIEIFMPKVTIAVAFGRVKQAAAIDVQIGACSIVTHLCAWVRAEDDQLLEIDVVPGEYVIRALQVDAEFGNNPTIGYYAADAPGNLTTDRNAATVINLTDDITGIEITLP